MTRSDQNKLSKIMPREEPFNECFAIATGSGGKRGRLVDAGASLRSDRLSLDSSLWRSVRRRRGYYAGDFSVGDDGAAKV